MPWYKLPHSNLVMWFDQKMPDLERARKPRVKRVKKPAVKPVEPVNPVEPKPPATGGAVKGSMSKVGYPTGVIDEVVIPDEPIDAHVWGTGAGVTFDSDPCLVPAPEKEAGAE